MNFIQENIAAISSASIVALFSFIFSVNSDVAVLKSRSAGSEKTSDLILKEIRFVKVNQGKIHKEITDTRERVIKLEVKLNERQIAK